MRGGDHDLGTLGSSPEKHRRAERGTGEALGVWDDLKWQFPF